MQLVLSSTIERASNPAGHHLPCIRPHRLAVRRPDDPVKLLRPPLALAPLLGALAEQKVYERDEGRERARRDEGRHRALNALRRQPDGDRAVVRRGRSRGRHRRRCRHRRRSRCTARCRMNVCVRGGRWRRSVVRGPWCRLRWSGRAAHPRRGAHPSARVDARTAFGLTVHRKRPALGITLPGLPEASVGSRIDAAL